MRGKRVDPEIKKKITKLYLSGTRTGISLAKELGIHRNTVYKWIKQYHDNPAQAFAGSGKLHSADEELRKAKRKIRELENRLAILRQAAIYFANNNNK